MKPLKKFNEIVSEKQLFNDLDMSIHIHPRTDSKKIPIVQSYIKSNTLLDLIASKMKLGSILDTEPREGNVLVFEKGEWVATSTQNGLYGEVEDYRSSLEESDYIYSGYILNDVPTIVRCINDTETTAQNVTNLETDWTNRLNLIYN